MKIVKILFAVGLLSQFAQATTVTVSPGVGAQGYNVLVNGVAPTNFYWSVGTYSGGVYTQFGTSVLDTAKVNGGVTATSPTSVDNLPLVLFVGVGQDIASSGTGWILLTPTTPGTQVFPSDVTQANSVTYAASLTNTQTVLAKGNAANGFDVIGASGGNLNLITVPEPSAALLGMLGALGLLRRRR